VKRIVTWIFLILIAVYVIFAFVLPANPQTLAQHDISELQAKLLSLSIVIPISLIYLVAWYGFLRVDEYAKKIADTKEGPHFKTIALGLMVLAFNLPISSVIGSIRSYARHSAPELLAGATISRNYISMVLMVVAMVLIAKGIAGLYDTLKRRSTTHSTPPLYGLIGPILLASVYTYLIVVQSYSGDAATNPYILPAWVIIPTIAVPYVFAWCTGIWAARRLLAYQSEVKGIIYKRALDHIAKGLAVIILVSVLIQGLTSLAGVLNRLELTPLLTFIYFLLILYVVGFGLLARGANKLKLIEEA
jgi:hypothetical protein